MMMKPSTSNERPTNSNASFAAEEKFYSHRRVVQRDLTQDTRKQTSTSVLTTTKAAPRALTAIDKYDSFKPTFESSSHAMSMEPSPRSTVETRQALKATSPKMTLPTRATSWENDLQSKLDLGRLPSCDSSTASSTKSFKSRRLPPVASSSSASLVSRMEAHANATPHESEFTSSTTSRKARQLLAVESSSSSSITSPGESQSVSSTTSRRKVRQLPSSSSTSVASRTKAAAALPRKLVSTSSATRRRKTRQLPPVEKSSTTLASRMQAIVKAIPRPSEESVSSLDSSISSIDSNNSGSGGGGGGGSLVQRPLRLSFHMDCEQGLVPELEMEPGVYIQWRGAEETWNCIKNDFYRPTRCGGCSEQLCCIRDAAYVFCPVCRAVSSVEEEEDSSDDAEHQPHASKASSASSSSNSSGCGLGFTVDYLLRWQREVGTKAPSAVTWKLITQKSRQSDRHTSYPIGRSLLAATH